MSDVINNASNETLFVTLLHVGCYDWPGWINTLLNGDFIGNTLASRDNLMRIAYRKVVESTQEDRNRPSGEDYSQKSRQGSQEDRNRPSGEDYSQKSRQGSQEDRNRPSGEDYSQKSRQGSQEERIFTLLIFEQIIWYTMYCGLKYRKFDYHNDADLMKMIIRYGERINYNKYGFLFLTMKRFNTMKKKFSMKTFKKSAMNTQKLFPKVILLSQELLKLFANLCTSF